MATQNNISFSVDRKDVVLVKPLEPTPSEVLSFSTIDNDRNLELICHSVFVYKANDDYCNGDSPDEAKPKPGVRKDPACIIEEALSKLLVYYYPLAGKLKRQADGKLRITCNADGVPFLVATANCQLSSLNYLDGVDVQTAKQFAFDFPSESDDGYHPLVLQVTKFSCGGFTIAMSLSHSVCDGFGASQIFRALAELASGKSEPSVKPVWERKKLVAEPIKEIAQFTVDKDSLATSPYLPTTDIVHECFYITSENIKILKTNLMKESGDEFLKGSVTSLEVLGAYIWRARFRALKLNSDGKTVFNLAAGIRRILNPPLPEGFYGNAFTSANTAMTGRDLNEGSLTKAVKQIKESKKLASSNDYIWKLLSICEKFFELNMKFDPVPGATMTLTDWRQLGLMEDVDFGWKGSVNVIPLPWNMFGYVDLVLLLPPCKLDQSMKGGVRVLVSLPRAAIAKFREEMDALKHGDEAAGA
ncbi:HXXXD-type acyl-transferase family protein, putative [Theobroma cacao]|uniref:HXXXD-type acyl-transferase family protein, putative n=1 Tax=Theobroma cacao TaxID=3641 RepID=A0A061GZ63_THECC|nr:HXXXD-type acyl-transferase family protein, putative [Theobroma cacao]